MNRDSLTKFLKDTASTVKQSKTDSDNTSVAFDTKSISVLSIDLDDFKQINDTFGHLYGDLVLKSFADLITNVAMQYAEKNQVVLGRSLIVARQSGEEFVIALLDPLTNDDAMTLAEQIHRSLNESLLPNDEQWEKFTADNDGLSKPAPNKRQVTASIGVASTTALSQSTDGDATSLLISKADLAMYRAKAGGKNTVRNFADILKRHGAVVEHHVETDVVAIDIGAHVGVTSHQEFRVFHPSFSGGKAFYHIDGRTKKQLGEYPRRECGRIEVFEVQDSMSFCTIVAREGDALFAVGSFLEAIPLGSISHLIGPSSHFDGLRGTTLATPDHIPKVLDTLISEGSSPFAAIFTIGNITTITDEKGSAYVNRLLAILYSAIRNSFGNMATIALVQDTELAVITSIETADVEPRVLAALQEASTACSNAVTFKAGIFLEELFKCGIGDHSKLNPLYAVDYARYSALAATTGPTTFDSSIPPKIIWASRSAGRYAQGLEDYNRLRALGINNAFLENQAALCALESGLFPLALDCAKRATELLGSNAILWANLGLIERRNAQTGEDAFLTAIRLGLKVEVSRPYVLSVARMFTNQINKGRFTASEENARKWLYAAREMFQQRGFVVNDELSSAIETLDKEL